MGPAAAVKRKIPVPAAMTPPAAGQPGSQAMHQLARLPATYRDKQTQLRSIKLRVMLTNVHKHDF